MRRAVPVLLLAALVAACGGGDQEAADEVTTEEFCESYAAVEESEGFEDTKQGIADMAEQGLPDDAPEEAVKGFQVLADLAAEAKDDKQATELGSKIDAEGQQQVREFFTYATDACGPATPEAPTETPSE